MADGKEKSRIARILEKIGEGKFREAKEDINEGIYQEVVEPAAQRGEDTSLRSALAAGATAVSDVFLPDSPTDAALMAAGGPLIGVARKMGKARRAQKKIDKLAKVDEAPRKNMSAEEVADIEASVIPKQKWNSAEGRWVDPLSEDIPEIMERRHLIKDSYSRGRIPKEEVKRIKKLSDTISK